MMMRMMTIATALLYTRGKKGKSGTVGFHQPHASQGHERQPRHSHLGIRCKPSQRGLDIWVLAQLLSIHAFGFEEVENLPT